jgi:membrane protease YdiL (CAAX protease family)
MSLVEALVYPGRYVWTLNLGRFLPFLFLALIFIPIQTSAEELFFRGYVLQEFGLRWQNIWVLSGISGLLFGLPHLLNPEATVNFPLLGFYYFAFGFCLAFITLRDGKLELALGAHAANNLFSVIIANYTITALPSPSLFTIKVLDAVYSVPVAILGMGIFIFLFIGPWRRKEPAEKL